MSVILSVTTKELFTFWLCTLCIFGPFAIFKCFSSLWDFVYVYSHTVYSWSFTVSTFFSFSLWTPAVCDSSCITGYELCTLVTPNFLSLLSLEEIFLLHFLPPIHLQKLLLLTPCPQNTKPTPIAFRPSLEPTTSPKVRRWRPYFTPRISGDLWMARNLAPPLQAQSRLLGTSSRTEQLASWCSTLPQTSESTSKQTRTIPQRLGLHWRRSSSSRRPAAALWHMTSSLAFKNALKSPFLPWLLELRSPCSESRISTALLLILLHLTMSSLAWPWFEHLGPNTCISHHSWHCSLISTKTRSRLLSRLKKSIDNLAWMLLLPYLLIQHSLHHHPPVDVP